MEGVPRLPMLWVELRKSVESPSFAKLVKSIGEIYQEDPKSFSKDVNAIEALRNAAINPEKGNEGIKCLKRYYCQLHSLAHRFPQTITKNLTFTWIEKYSNIAQEYNDIKYELTSILFNIGALHTQVGASVQRTEVDGMKLACTHFQCAAWCFSELKEKYGVLLNSEDFMSEELLIFMQQISFAQAQECILEKSLIDNRKPIIVAKVTAQIINYYNTAMSALIAAKDKVRNNSSLSRLIFFTEGKDFRMWQNYVSFKVSYLSCVMFLYQGYQAEERQKMGERVAYYEAAYNKLQEASKDLKGIFDLNKFKESITFTHDVIEGKRDNAKKENEFIYHEEIPELNTLPSIQGANLVHGISFSVSDPEVAGEDIFGRLVPMEAHEGSSLYSEEKAQLLRMMREKVEEKNVELLTYMNSLNLESLNTNEERATRIPQGIVDRCAALNANTEAITDLISSISDLSNICAEVELSLKDIQNILTEEDTKENQYKQTSGEIHRNNAHLTELSKEFQKYYEAHNKACESNNTLRKAMELHVNNLKILSHPLQEIQNYVPKLSPPIGESLFKNLKLILNKAHEMRAQREQFFADLRIALSEDDITTKVVAKDYDVDLNELFKKEMSKHEKQVNLIEQNLSAQANILAALTEEYAKTAPFLKTLKDNKHQKENFYSSLAASYDVYEDLLAKSRKGLEFYKKLQGNIHKLFTRIRAARDVQNEDRELRLKAIQGIPSIQQSNVNNIVTVSNPQPTPKLRDYLDDQSKLVSNIPTVRPNPLGSESSPSTDTKCAIDKSINTFSNETPPTYSQSIQNQYYNNGLVKSCSQPSKGNSSLPYNTLYKYFDDYSKQYTKHSQPCSSIYLQKDCNQTFTSTYQSPQVYSQNCNNQKYDFQEKTAQNWHTISDLGQTSSDQGKSTDDSLKASYQNFPSYSELNFSYQGLEPAFYGIYDQFAEMRLHQQNYYQQSMPVITTPSNLEVSQYDRNYAIPSIISQTQKTNIDQNNQDSCYVQPINNQIHVNHSPTSRSQQNVFEPHMITSPIKGTNCLKQTLDNTSTQNEMSAFSTVAPSTLGMQEAFQHGHLKQAHSSSQQNQSYQYSHPGYVFNDITGNYEYTSGYQSQNNNPYYSQGGIPSFSENKSINSSSQDLNNQQEQLLETNSYYSIQYGQQPSNPKDVALFVTQINSSNNMTYTQSGKDSQTVQTTQSESKFVQHKQDDMSSEKSTFDLLSDLDFLDGQTPLQPAIIATKVDTTRRVSLPAFNNSEKKLENFNNIELLPEENSKSDQQQDITNSKYIMFDDLQCPQTTPTIIAVDINKKSRRNPFENPKTRNSFLKEVERYEKVIEALNIKTLNGKTPLMNKWNELNESLIKNDSSNRTSSIAKLFPEKNYNNDCIPYNDCLVRLDKATDDYINAAFVKNLTLGDIPSMFIIGQTPLPNTVSDFWSMIFTQKARVAVCLHTPKEMIDMYWPFVLNKEQYYGDFSVNLMKIEDLSNCIEFQLKVVANGADDSFHVSLLQIKSWSKIVPIQPISIAKNIIDSYRNHFEKISQHFPIVLTCLTGSERSGIMAVAICTVLATRLSRPMLIDIVDVWNKICCTRKNVIKDISVLEFSLNIVLAYGHELLNEYGIMTSYQMKIGQALLKETEDLKDPLNDLDPLWKMK